MMDKKWWSIITIVLVISLMGIINAITGDVTQDIRDDQTDAGVTNCGTNSTGGSGGTINYNACPAYTVGNHSLTAQIDVADKQGTLVTAGIGIFIITLILAGIAGISYYR